MASKSYFRTVLEDRTIFFELSPSEMYQGNKIIPIHWEEQGQVFVGEIALDDLATLDWKTG